jgi:hypothetical protein
MIAAIKRASEIFHINISTEYTKQIANLSNGKYYYLLIF